jgi:cytochrome c556
VSRALLLSAGAVVALIALMVSPGAHEHATGIVKERMDGMAAMAKSMKSINQRIKAGRDLEGVRTEAESVLVAASKIPAWFPSGSNQHPTEAKEEIWRNWADFQSKGHALEAEVAKLVTLDKGNPKTVATQVRAVGHACSACHELYREKTNRPE